MNPHEEAIDKVLTALRDTPVPQHLNNRILNSIEEARHSEPSIVLGSPRTTPRTFFGSILPSGAQRRGRPERSRMGGIATLHVARTALACCAVLALVALALIHLKSDTATTINATNPTDTGAHTPPTASPAKISAAAPAPHPRASISPHPTQPQPVEVAESEDNQQISHPAPPIPLTDQERLLLRYTRRGRSEDLAQITNERKAAKEQQDATDFQAFFEPIIVTGESE